MAFWNNITEAKKRMIEFHEVGSFEHGIDYCQKRFYKNVLLKRGELIWQT